MSNDNILKNFIEDWEKRHQMSMPDWMKQKAEATLVGVPEEGFALVLEKVRDAQKGGKKETR